MQQPKTSQSYGSPNALISSATNTSSVLVRTLGTVLCIFLRLGIAVLASVNGPKLCAVCPRCRKSDDEKPKRFFAICGIARGDYDEEIPHEYFQMPPPGLEAGRQGLEALRV